MKNLKIILGALTVLISMPAIGMQREERDIPACPSAPYYYNMAVLQRLPLDADEREGLALSIDSRLITIAAHGINEKMTQSMHSHLMNNPNTIITILEGFGSKQNALRVASFLRDKYHLPIMRHPTVAEWIARLQ